VFKGCFLLNPKQNLTTIKSMKDRLHYQTWLWVVMKHSVCQFILATFLISALEARDTHAQNLLERIVTIHLDQTDVGKFVSTLEKATGVEFVYSSKAIGANRKLSVHQINQKLSVVLETTLKPMNIGYRLVDGSILLHKAASEPFPSLEEPVNSIEQPAESTRTEINITGSVTDEKGEGLPGVSILVKGTQRGTATGANGTYTASALPQKRTFWYFPSSDTCRKR
jgi:hypothetical protein